MSFTKEDKQYLDRLMSSKFDAFERLVDYKIQVAKEDIETKASGRHNDTLNHFDKVLTEVKTNREERTVQAHHIIRNTKRIEKLEKAVFKN